MKILKMIGLVVAVHVVVLTFGFILPGCQSTARTSPAAADKHTDPNISRIDAARSTGAVGQPAHTPSAAPTANTYTPQPTPVSNTFTGGPVTDFGTAAPVAAAPIRPQTAADNPALPAAEPAEAPAMLTYTVASGDNPWTISKKFKIKTDDLLAANGLNSKSTLQIGQKLKIPAKVASSRSTLATHPGTTVYKVQPNDSLGTIARRHNTSVEQIQSLNKLSGASIRIGQELFVPAIADAPVTAAQTATAAVETPAATATAKGTTITHTVKPGENLEGIARYYGASITEIGTTNHITDPRKLRAGQTLTITSAKKNIPANAAAPATTPAPAATGTTQPTQTTPLPPVDNSSPVSPVSPVIDSPISPTYETPAYENPPVTTPQDPVSPLQQ